MKVVAVRIGGGKTLKQSVVLIDWLSGVGGKATLAVGKDGAAYGLSADAQWGNALFICNDLLISFCVRHRFIAQTDNCFELTELGRALSSEGEA